MCCVSACTCTCSPLCACLWSVQSHVCVGAHRCAGRTCETLGGGSEEEGIRAFLFRDTPALPGSPDGAFRLPAAWGLSASGSAAARQARPGPGLRVSQGGRLGLREAEAAGSRPALGGFAPLPMEVFLFPAPGSCLESTSPLHTTEAFYFCLSAALSRTQGDTGPGVPLPGPWVCLAGRCSPLGPGL